MPVAVNFSVGWYHASLIVTPPFRIEWGTLHTLCGVIRPSWSGPARVGAVCAEPGSSARRAVGPTGGGPGGKVLGSAASNLPDEGTAGPCHVGAPRIAIGAPRAPDSP